MFTELPLYTEYLGTDTDGTTLNPSEELKISHFAQQISFLFHLSESKLYFKY